MYIVLCTSKNKDMIESMKDAIKEKFQLLNLQLKKLNIGVFS